MKRRHIYLIAIALVSFTSFCIAQKEIFMFSYFKDNGEDGLHLAYSLDGYKWESLKGDSSVLKPKVSNDKLMRDPCIIKGPDQIYRMVWTVSWADKGIGYASSKDLIHWSKQEFIPVMKQEDSAQNCWAPEITYDKANKQYMIYWATTIKGLFKNKSQESEDQYNHRIYYITTKDFQSYSKTKLLYDDGFNVIDATILPANNRFYMFLKDETLYPPQKNIRIAQSENLTGPYSHASEPITGDYWAEGPTITKVKDGWILYFDRYKDGKYGALFSSDLKTWKDVSDKIALPKGIRHGSIFKVPYSIYSRLESLHY